MDNKVKEEEKKVEAREVTRKKETSQFCPWTSTGRLLWRIALNMPHLRH